VAFKYWLFITSCIIALLGNTISTDLSVGKAWADILHVPDFVTFVPPGNFAGVSAPMSSLAEARKSAVGNVVRQILGSIGARYHHSYVDNVSGNVRGKGPERIIDDRLIGITHGIVLDVEQNVVQSSWSRDRAGKYVYFVLVWYPEKLISRMRRLSKGAKIIASPISMHDGYVRLKISEVNGVAVTLSSANVKVHKRNRFAKAITLFFWRVPSESELNHSVSFDPVKVCGNSKPVELSLERSRKDFADYLVGAEFKIMAVFKGHDEIGRHVSLTVTF